MPSLTDLFNPTFLIFLGILVLVVALLVVYFETKFREQNHKISSMLSLVSSLAEEVNGTKMVIHQLSMNQGPRFYQQQQQEQPSLEKKIIQTDNLITVSDDEDSDSDDDSDSDAGSENSFDEIESTQDSDSDDDDVSVIEIGDHNNDVKILKLNISSQSDDISQSDDNFDVDNLDELDELDELDDSSDTESIKENNNLNETKNNIKSIDLKSINITLEETKTEQPLDYKKLSLPKLRSVVSEKGLTPDSSKLKKNELFKLLGVE